MERSLKSQNMILMSYNSEFHWHDSDKISCIDDLQYAAVVMSNYSDHSEYIEPKIQFR